MPTSNPDTFIEAYSAVASQNQTILKKTAGMLARLNSKSIDFILLKGADLINRLYGIKGLRPMTDVDLLVREKDLPAIDDVFRENGYTPRIDGNPAYIDPEKTFHFDIITDLWYIENSDIIWQRSIQTHLGTVPVRVMEASDLLVLLTAHVVVHWGYLSKTFAKDMALLVEKENIDWKRVLSESAQYHLKRPLYHGFTYARRCAGAQIPEDVISSLVPSSPSEKFEYSILKRLVTTKKNSGVSFFLLFLTQPGWKRWQWLKRGFFPSKNFLRYRYGTRSAQNPLRTILFRWLYLIFQAVRVSAKILVLLLKPYKGFQENTRS